MCCGPPGSSTTSKNRLADRGEPPAAGVHDEEGPERDRPPLGAARGGVVVLVDPAHDRLGRQTREMHGRNRQAGLEIAHRLEEVLPALLLPRREARIGAPPLAPGAGLHCARSERSPLSSRCTTGVCTADSVTAAGGGAGTRTRAGSLDARAAPGSGTRRAGAVSLVTAGGTWLARTVSRRAGGTGGGDGCHARQGVNHHSAAAIATAPTPPIPHQSRDPGPARGTEVTAGCVCAFESTSGLVGVLSWAISADPAPAFASVIISPRTGSSCRSDGRPHTATTSSMPGQRRAGSFSSIRMTPAPRLGGQSGRSSATGRGRSLKCAYITAMVESLLNGSRPVSISYATTPREY